MSYSITGKRSGNGQTYTLGGVQMLHVEAVTLTIDGTAAGSSFYATVEFLAQNGQLIARSQSSASISSGSVSTMTFAPDLPDTAELQTAGLTLEPQTGLANTSLPPLSRVTATVSDAAAIVTTMRLWVDDVIDDATASDGEAATFGAWALVPGAGA